jgi:TRAP-type transport system small permease protein
MKLLRSLTEIWAAFILVLIVSVVCIQVVGRYFLHLSLPWPEELARYLLVWLVFIGGAAAVGAGEQLVVDTLMELSSPRYRRLFRFIAPIGGLIGICILLYTCIPLFGPASRTVSPATGIPAGWVYLALPVGSVLAGLFLLDSLYREMFGRNRKSDDGLDEEVNMND